MQTAYRRKHIHLLQLPGALNSWVIPCGTCICFFSTSPKCRKFSRVETVYSGSSVFLWQHKNNQRHFSSPSSSKTLREVGRRWNEGYTNWLEREIKYSTLSSLVFCFLPTYSFSNKWKYMSTDVCKQEVQRLFQVIVPISKGDNSGKKWHLFKYGSGINADLTSGMNTTLLLPQYWFQSFPWLCVHCTQQVLKHVGKQQG